VGDQRRRRDDDARHLGQLDCHDGLVVDLADLDRAVDAFGDEVGAAVVQQPLDVDARIARQVLGQRGDELLLAERVRRDDAQRAFGLVARAASRQR